MLAVGKPQSLLCYRSAPAAHGRPQRFRRPLTVCSSKKSEQSVKGEGAHKKESGIHDPIGW